MKNKFFYCLFLLLPYFNKTTAQKQLPSPPEACMQNGDFAIVLCENTAASVIGGCLYFSDNCVPNWQRSHGTPQIEEPSANASDNYVYMWAFTSTGGAGNYPAGAIGEGIVGTYNFVANQQYTISVRSSISSTAANAGFNLFVSNGVQHSNNNSPTFGCGELPPVPTSAQNVTVNTQINQGWQVYTYTFTPNANYSQIWIYPFSSGTTSATMANMSLNYVHICPLCNSLIQYNENPVPSGTTSYGEIDAGTSVTGGAPGTGNVTVNTLFSTTFTASEVINLLPNFNAAITSGIFFDAKIVSCSDNTVFLRPAQADLHNNVYMPINSNQSISNNEDSLKAYTSNNKITIYPNPANDVINISFNGVKEGISTIEIKDVNGKTVLQKNISINSTGDYNTSINVRALSNGVYFIAIKSDSYNQTEKIIIER